MGKFRDRIVIITGGESGIGKATSAAFAREGATIFIAGLDADLGERAAAELSDFENQVTFFKVDVRDSKQVAGFFKEIDQRSGRIDILFNNVGRTVFGHVDQLSETDWDICFDTNLKGAFLMSKAVIPRMRQQGGGVIINNSSNAGLVARATGPAYCAAKAGLIMLTKAMALSHAPDKIRVNAVAPGPVMTEAMERALSQAEDPKARAAESMAAAPLAAAKQRMITPEEIAAAVLYLCSDEASMVTGAVLAIDGGKSAGIPR